MNFIFISPNYPESFWLYCDRLKQNGVNVLGIGEGPFDTLKRELKEALTEYYFVPSMQDYDAMYRAVAYFASKYGRIDWIESNNEYWLELDARLRTDFNVRTGFREDTIDLVKKKSLMKQVYRELGIPSARQHAVTTLQAGREFIDEVGFPVIVKPNVGVGAIDTWKLENEQQLEDFYRSHPEVPYVMEEFVEGVICSYDAISDSMCQPLFENMSVFQPSMVDIAEQNLNLTYTVCPVVAPQLREYGRKCLQGFGAARRFVHMEFFRLDKARKGLGKAGDFVALEVNVRPAGGRTPDMMNFAHSTDTFRIWADMVAFDRVKNTSEGQGYYCGFANRKNGHNYLHTHEEIMERYGDKVVLQEAVPEIDWALLGKYMYIARLDTQAEADAFGAFVTAKA